MNHADYIQAVKEHYIQTVADSVPRFIADSVAYEWAYADVVENTNPENAAPDGKVAVLFIKNDDVLEVNIPLGDIKAAALTLSSEYGSWMS